MSGKLGQITVVVFQKVSVDRNVGPATNHPRKSAVRPAASPPVSVIDLTVGGRLGNVNRRGVHFGSQHRGERAVLADVRAAPHRDYRRYPIVDDEPQRESPQVSDSRMQYAWNSSQWSRRYVQEPAFDSIVGKRIEDFDHSLSHHDYPGGVMVR